MVTSRQLLPSCEALNDYLLPDPSRFRLVLIVDGSTTGDILRPLQFTANGRLGSQVSHQSSFATNFRSSQWPGFCVASVGGTMPFLRLCTPVGISICPGDGFVPTFSVSVENRLRVRQFTN